MFSTGQNSGSQSQKARSTSLPYLFSSQHYHYFKSWLLEHAIVCLSHHRPQSAQRSRLLALRMVPDERTQKMFVERTNYELYFSVVRIICSSPLPGLLTFCFCFKKHLLILIFFIISAIFSQSLSRFKQMVLF